MGWDSGRQSSRIPTPPSQMITATMQTVPFVSADVELGLTSCIPPGVSVTFSWLSARWAVGGATKSRPRCSPPWRRRCGSCSPVMRMEVGCQPATTQLASRAARVATAAPTGSKLQSRPSRYLCCPTTRAFARNGFLDIQQQRSARGTGRYPAAQAPAVRGHEGTTAWITVENQASLRARTIARVSQAFLGLLMNLVEVIILHRRLKAHTHTQMELTWRCRRGGTLSATRLTLHAMARLSSIVLD